MDKKVGYAVGFLAAHLLAGGILAILSLVIGVNYFLIELPGLIELVPIAVLWIIGIIGGYLGFRLFQLKENARVWAGGYYATFLALQVIGIVYLVIQSSGDPLQGVSNALFPALATWWLLFDKQVKGAYDTGDIYMPTWFVVGLTSLIVVFTAILLYI